MDELMIDGPSPGPLRLRMRSSGFIAALALCLLSSGCRTTPLEWIQNGLKVGPNYCRPMATVPNDWIEPAESGLRREPAVDGYWWSAFEDPTLSRLIQTAYCENLDLKVAVTRILNARAQRNIAFGNLFPQSQTATAGYVHAQVPRNLGVGPLLPNTVSVWDVGFNASWEVDLWGRYRRSIEAADGEFAASVEDYGDALVMLLSEVASAYIRLRTFEQRLEFARKNVEVLAGTAELAEERYRAGSATEIDVAQAKSNLAQTQALIHPLVTGKRQAANQLCILTGQPVSEINDELGTGPIPRPPLEIAVGIPADLLCRRPDIRKAERQAAAQAARIGVAEADLYPKLAVSGFLGYAATDVPDLLSPGSFAGYVFPTLQWKVLNYGRIMNNIRAQDAAYTGAVYSYRQSILDAGREVEDELIAFVEAKKQVTRLEEGVEAAGRAMELVLAQYRAGATDFNRVYNTQSLLVNQQDQLAQARGNVAVHLVGAYRALGGGWEYFSQGEIIFDTSTPSVEVSPEAPFVPAPN